MDQLKPKKTKSSTKADPDYQADEEENDAGKPKRVRAYKKRIYTEEQKKAKATVRRKRMNYNLTMPCMSCDVSNKLRDESIQFINNTHKNRIKYGPVNKELTVRKRPRVMQNIQLNKNARLIIQKIDKVRRWKKRKKHNLYKFFLSKTHHFLKQNSIINHTSLTIHLTTLFLKFHYWINPKIKLTEKLQPRATGRSDFLECLQIAEQQSVVGAESTKMANQTPASQVDTPKPAKKERERESMAMMALSPHATNTAVNSKDKLSATPKRAIMPRARTTPCKRATTKSTATS